MISLEQKLKILQDPELGYIKAWLINNKLYNKLKSELGIIHQIHNTEQLPSTSAEQSLENCIETFNKCSHYVEYRKLHLKQYLWLRRNNLLKEFQKRINYSKYHSVTHASKYSGRFSITYNKCIKDWNDGNFKFKSDYYRCFSGNFKYLERNYLLDKFLDEVLNQ